MKNKFGWVMVLWANTLVGPPIFVQNLQEDYNNPSPAKSAEPEKPNQEPYLFGNVQLPLEDYSRFHFRRMLGEKEISLEDIVSTQGVVLHLTKETLSKDDKEILKKQGLSLERLIAPNYALVSLMDDALGIEAILHLVNTQYREKPLSFTSGASPILLFDGGRDPQYLTGKIVIEWGTNVRMTEMQSMLDRIGLKLADGKKDFDEKTRIMVVETTAKSGHNVLRLAQIFGPQNGNIYVKSVEPQFAPLEVPLAVESRISPADGKSHAGGIAGSLFHFVMELRVRPNVRISLNELKATATALKQWLPKSAQGEKKEVSPQVFELVGPEKITTYARDSHGIERVIILYRFRLSQSGEFTLAPPSVQYDVYDPQTKRVSTEKVGGKAGGSAVPFRVAGTMPMDATMVNDIAEMPDFPVTNPYLNGARWREISTYCFVAAAIMGVVLSIWFFAVQLGRHDSQLVSNRDRALTLWRSEKPALRDLLGSDAKGFWHVFPERARLILGICARGDEQFFAPMSSQEIIETFAGGWPVPDRQALERFFEVLFTAQFAPAGSVSAEEAMLLLEEFESFLR